MTYFFSFFFLFLIPFLAAEEEIVERLTSECDALSLVEGTVNVCNGQLVQMDKDTVIAGSDPLELTRIYDSGFQCHSEWGYGIGVSFPIELRANLKKHKGKVYVDLRSGMTVPFKVRRPKGTSLYQGKIAPSLFEKGFTNSPKTLLKGERSLLAAKIQGDKSQFVLNLGDGTKRHYERTEDKGLLYRIILEERPNGNLRYFSYDSSKKTFLKKVWTTNSDGTLVFNALDFSRGENHLQATVKGSQGEVAVQHAHYLKKRKNLIDCFLRLLTQPTI